MRTILTYLPIALVCFACNVEQPTTEPCDTINEAAIEPDTMDHRIDERFYYIEEDPIDMSFEELENKH